MKLEGPAMVTSPTGKGVILMGGRTHFNGRKNSLYPNENSKAMFELTDSMEWNQMEQTLQHDHDWHITIPIPDELVKEKVKSEK